MGFPFSNLPVLLAATLFVASINIHASADMALIDSICSKSLRPDICHTILQQSANEDLPTIADRVLVYALSSCRENAVDLASQAEHALPPLKQILETCADQYGDKVPSDLHSCETDLWSGDYSALKNSVKDVGNQAKVCREAFEDQVNFPKGVILMQVLFENVVSILTVIANKFNVVDQH